MRLAGVLLPVSALNGDYGIGDFGSSAYEFIDIISDMGFKLWQILPLNPLGEANSPYKPCSSYAGDEIYIDLEYLYNNKLLEELPEYIPQTSRIDYDVTRAYKQRYLKMAFNKFIQKYNCYCELIQNKSEVLDDSNVEHNLYREFSQFIQTNDIYNYAVFITLKNHFKKSWDHWNKRYKYWERYQNTVDKIELDNDDMIKFQQSINYHLFIQYIFYKQWMKLKSYAHDKSIKILGDIPIYVGYDSADVWQDKKCFLLNKNARPSFVAGVPPDYFNKKGQRWGNPLYDWDYIKQTDFKYWINRLFYNAKLYDIIRIDHFRAFDTYWKIKASNKTAIKGEWIMAPGRSLFRKIASELPDIQIVVEDLGDLRPEVHKLRDEFHLMGMNIMQFTFNPDELGERYNTNKDIVLYTGTHDNTTIKAYFESQCLQKQKSILQLLKKCGASFSNIELCYLEVMFSNIADYAIAPVADLLGLGDEARINTPGTVTDDNWSYKLTSLEQLKQRKHIIKNILTKTNRSNGIRGYNE